MDYYFTKIVTGTFEKIEQQLISLLKAEGFGVLTEIDMQTTLKRKLDVDFRAYKILGACNPPFAYEALQAEDKIGAMLPCNFITQEHAKDQIEVSAINPIVSMAAVRNEALEKIAQKVTDKLRNLINNLNNEK
jgi:uncharacterized protein (DUF302 family)